MISCDEVRQLIAIFSKVAELPLLVYRELFGRHFSFKEKQRLRLVCKKWNCLIEESQKELVVYKKISPCGVKWPDTEQRIDFERDAVETNFVFELYEKYLNKNFERVAFPKYLRKLWLHLKFTVCASSGVTHLLIRKNISRILR